MKYHDVALCIPIPRFFRSLISKMASKWNFVNLRTHVGGGVVVRVIVRLCISFDPQGFLGC